jgi:hypothetical protein
VWGFFEGACEAAPSYERLNGSRRTRGSIHCPVSFCPPGGSDCSAAWRWVGRGISAAKYTRAGGRTDEVHWLRQLESGAGNFGGR